MTSKKHLDAVKLGQTQTRLESVAIKIDKKNSFHYELVNSLVSANIPVNKLENFALRSFIKNFTHEKLYSHTHYRGVILEQIYKDRLDMIKNEIASADGMYLIFNETTDSCKRYMLNILLGGCFVDKRSKPFLIAIVELEKITAVNVNSKIISILNEFFENKIDRINKIKLVLSDAAPYALKAAKMFKVVAPGLKHVTYLCHALHNLCETVREKFFRVDIITAYMKRTLVKNNEKQVIFKDLTKLALPSWPIITR